MTATDEDILLYAGQASRRDEAEAEADALERWARAVNDRYPLAVWPDGGDPPAPGSREAAASQKSFVAGIRFACSQFQLAAADLRGAIESEQRS